MRFLLRKIAFQAGPGARATGLAIACLLVGGIATLADTIVLKNGKRVPALTVVEDGDKVRYQTSAGELTLPKSIVDHIERGGGVLDSGNSGAAALALTAPAIETSEEIEKGVVHDGGIDRQYLANVELNARSGESKAKEAAALAHHVAAQFEFSRGTTEEALAQEREALRYSPEDTTLLMEVAFLHLRNSQFKESLEYLDRARRTVPNNADEAKLEGWAYYGLSKLDRAVTEWKRALALRPDAEVQAALAKALRDKKEEDSYRENESAHFLLRYTGEAEPALAREVLRALEAHFSAIESELDFTPPEQIAVILYTQQAFADITQAPGWVGALNDGRIRVPVQGLTALTPELSRVLKHELTHSFIKQKTQGRAPTWINEGLAQWMEGKRSGDNAAAVWQTYQQNVAPPPGALEGSWMKLPTDYAAVAYAWGLAMVEYIVQTDGMRDMERILDRLAAGSSTEEAMHEVLRDGYSEVMESTAQYLRKTYGQ